MIQVQMLMNLQDDDTFFLHLLDQGRLVLAGHMSQVA